MEYKANYAIVGAFVTLIAVAFAGFVYWFSAADSSVARTPYTIVFDGAVTGLGAGTNVLFNGLPVGEVIEIGINPDDPSQVLAQIQVAADAPVMNDTRAILEIQGLTGVAHIQLLGGTLAAGRLEPAPGETAAVLQGQPSDFQLIMEGARDIVASAESTFTRIDSFFVENEDRLSATLANIESLSSSLAGLVGDAGDGSDFQAIVTNARDTLESATATFERIESFVTANEESLGATIANAETFSAALASNAGGVENFLSSVTRTSDQIGPLADELRNLTADIREIVDVIPPDQVRQTFDDISTFSQSLSANVDNIDGFFDDARSLASNLSGVSDGLQGTLNLIDQASSTIDPDVIARAMDNIDTFSDALGSNADNVDEIMVNARALTETLNGAAERADALIARIDGMIATEDGESLFAEAGSAIQSIQQLAERLDTIAASDDVSTLLSDLSEAASSFRRMSDNLDAQMNQVTLGITDFTNRGLGAYTSLANDARGTLQRLDRILQSIERNPQVLVFGGDTIRDFRP
ncbi:MlaD family protein [Pelagibacterium xiamenense]|uniref:MlaD family protein n=1 Tax=Pelagibacterium xiamenense TaxID=2901140 RepID=UPI001E610B48|nr:MlaD family protein [Pelagibacterium xiamenense]MCD7059406.1 MlaD family protein [Pelagibacterium xiamenense]